MSKEQQEFLEEIAPDTFEKQEDIEKEEENGFLSALLASGLSPLIASAVIAALSNDESVVKLLQENKQPLIFMTQRDSKVDDVICLPKQGEVYSRDDPKRPRIPLSLHPNCRCFWQDGITGKNLGQF